MVKTKLNFLFPIIIFIIVVLVLSVITTIVFSLLEKHTNIDIPWNDNFKEENEHIVRPVTYDQKGSSKK